ncbi:MAG: metallophosphoesterase family protein [Candidatus Hadarchaeales archaeon]
MFRRDGMLAILDEEFKGRVLVAGDIHGDLEAFLSIRKIFGEDQEALLIFLGDYADRGENGLEVIRGVAELVEKNPERIIPLKGNHEDYRDGEPWFSPWTLGEEVEAKTGSSWEDFLPELEDFLGRLFLAALIPEAAIFVHGGMSSKVGEVRRIVEPSREVEEDILWSDPMDEDGELPNPRGAGVLFGPDVSRMVLERLGVKMVIRGHQPQKAYDGPFFEHEGRVVTLSSTNVYGGRPFLLDFRCGEDLKREKMDVIYLGQK